jgi:hypothetical protein
MRSKNTDTTSKTQIYDTEHPDGPQIGPVLPGSTSFNQSPDGSVKFSFPSKPLTMWGILVEAFQICRSNAVFLLLLGFIPIVVMVMGPLLTATVVGNLRVIVMPGFAFLPDPFSSIYKLDMGFPIWGSTPYVALAFAFSPFSYGALTYWIAQVCSGRRPTLGESYQAAFKLYVRLFLAYFIIWLVIFVSTDGVMALGYLLYHVVSAFGVSGWWSAVAWPFLALIPAIIVPRVSLLDLTAVVDGQNCAGGLVRSWKLLRGKAEQGGLLRSLHIRYAILLIAFYGISKIFFFIFLLSSQVLIHAVPESLRFAAAVYGIFILYLDDTLSNIIIAACNVVFYFDARKRHAGALA